MKTLLSYVSGFGQRALAMFHRTDRVKGTDQAKADSAERRERWDQVISEHRKPNQPHP